MMGKKIKLTESQLYTLMEMGEPQVYEKHWNHMLERSILVLLKMGYSPEILKGKIDEIVRRKASTEVGEQYGEANTTSSLNGSH
jgi:hypothetical protein